MLYDIIRANRHLGFFDNTIIFATSSKQIYL